MNITQLTNTPTLKSPIAITMHGKPFLIYKASIIGGENMVFAFNPEDPSNPLQIFNRDYHKFELDDLQSFQTNHSDDWQAYLEFTSRRSGCN